MYLAPHLIGLSAIIVLPMFPKAREIGGHKPMLGHKHMMEVKSHHHHQPHHHNDVAATTTHSNGHMHKGK